jgi:tellurite resistance protein TerC
MYFLLHGLLDKLIYLSIGLAVILAFIGVKLILHALHETTGDTPEIPLALSLGFIVVTLIVTAVASLWAVRRNPELAHTVGMAADAEKDAEILAGDELRRIREGEAPDSGSTIS